ncbi:Ig-like domain-containing protein [Actinospica robiniae]|uniref:Ig-like domain-containing protein n=1 Tax=Actinospica robiniae TaxID=304901 RepID=UPI000400FFBB|nr:Ig-like domain-containing protein [Actinospica robiniae]
MPGNPAPPFQKSPRLRTRSRSLLAASVTTLLASASLVSLGVAPSAEAATSSASTAWHDGLFALNPDGVASRSDIVLGQPNINPTASIPLGNGTLGVAAWAANGFTAQLNRSDTMPDRKSPGQLEIPGLSVISHASDFSGKLDLTDGVLEESGGGMTMKAWVSSVKDELIVDVTGANPNVAQTASINLWSGRNPTAAVSGNVGTLSETWVDNSEDGSGGQTFGSLAAITAGARDLSVSVASPVKVQASFKPKADGSFRVVVAAPSWTGGNAASTAQKLLGLDAALPEPVLTAVQKLWWGAYWAKSGSVELNSADGSAAYIENLRTLYLYDEAASEKAGTYPGNQAGDADMFDWSQDKQTWTPSEYWLWNMRAEISANMSAGEYQLNQPIFDMYINDLSSIEAWTTKQMGGLPGACVPEVMRFNGNGGSTAAGANSACSEPGSPNWNALDITSGSELSLYMWEQYQATGDLAFLKRAFPFMEATVQFLVAYQQVGTDGLLHGVANAHETQWAVQDPTTDIAAEQAMLPIIAQAAKLVGDTSAEDPLLARFAQADNEIPPYPRTDDATRKQLLDPDYTAAEAQAADATGNDMIAISYQPAASRQNGENIELEPLWPWNDVSDQDTNMFALEQRSYTHRPNVGGNDWSLDSIDAARLEQPSQVESDLVSLTTSHQVYPNGFSDIGSSVGYQPYMEQTATVAAGVDEALAQDYDGIIRFAPAVPSDWDASGTVYVQHNDKVDVQVENGQLVTAAIQAGSSGSLQVENPWPGQQVEVVSGTGTHRIVVKPTTAAVITVPAVIGQSYLVEQPSAPTTSLPFATVTGTAPTADKHLGKVQIGLDAAGPATTATVGTVLGSKNVSDGVTQVDYAGSTAAQTTASDVDGLSARSTVNAAGAASSGTENDMYFGIDPSVAATSSYGATFTVSYYDAGTASVALQYDNGVADPDHTAGTIQLTGTDTWKTATFSVTGAYFGGLENAGADFRLDSDGPITAHSVAVSVTGPAVPAGAQFPPVPVITSPKSGATAKLASSISGTAEPDGLVTVSSGSATLCTGTASDAGAWSCAPANGLTAGKVTVSATATDPTGLVSANSGAVSFYASDLPPGNAVVASVVGATNVAYGMSEDETPSGGFDGPTTASDIGGLSARTSTDSNIYFNIDDSIAHAGDYTAKFTVSYYDQGTGSFQVQFDNGSSDPYSAASPSIPLTNTNTWKTATVTANDAYFGGLQHSAADFRLRNGSGQVTVHSVVVDISGDGVANVTDFPPAVSITGPAAGDTVTSTPTVTGTSEPDATVTVTGAGSTLCTTTASDSGTWSCSASTALVDGPLTLTAIATDLTSSPVTSAPVQVTVAS